MKKAINYKHGKTLIRINCSDCNGVIMRDSTREKVRNYIKKNMDISDLIAKESIKNEDLSYARISKLNKTKEDLSGCNFSYAIIGEADTITNLCGANLHGCSFYRAKFLGVTWVRHAKATNCNFTSCDLSKLDYAYCDFRNSTFCHCIIKIGSREGYKAKFSKNFFDALTRFWDIDGMSEKSEQELNKINCEE